MIAQNGSIFKKIVTLQDRTSPSGSALFGGSVVYCLCDDVQYSGKANQAVTTVVMPAMPDFVGSNVGSVWQGMIANSSYTGVENPTVSVNGNWTTDLGSYGTAGLSEPILTPYKILLMAASGRTFYLQDERVIENIIIESGSQWYGQYGMPVTINTFAFNARSQNDTNLVSWSLSLREDKP